MSATVTAPEHLQRLRESLERLEDQAADVHVAREKLAATAREILADELRDKGKTPMWGAVSGAVFHAAEPVITDIVRGLEVCGAARDAIAVLDLAISRAADV